MYRFSKTVSLAFLLCLIISITNAQKTDRTVHYIVNINGPWFFKVDSTNIGIQKKWYLPETEFRDWTIAKVPGIWDSLGLASYDGAGWYRRDFLWKPQKGRKVAVVFGSVDDNAEVWINGVHAGTHVGYGQKFHIEATSLLKKGRNTIVVRIEDIAGPGGITGSVVLQPYTKEEDLLVSSFHRMVPVRSFSWVKDAVVYELYPRSFTKEGTFKSIEPRLGELKDLGVTVLWLMPVNPVGEVHRKGSLGSPYSVRDYRAVNPEFGTMDDFRSLVKAVHAMGMHIIVDLVANHTSWDNPLIKEHPEWYTHDRSGAIVSPNPDWTDVADLDYTQPGLRSWMIDMMCWWVRDVGIDGFRCDVAEMVPTDFWRSARAALGAIKPVMMLAEGSLPDEHIDAFDVTYAWNTYDVLYPIMQGSLSVEALDGTLKGEYYQFPQGALRLRFSSNHDKNVYDAPAVERYSVDGAKAAAILMSTLPGIPLIYNGDEVGNAMRLDLFEKRTINWDGDTNQFRMLYSSLNKFRAATPALRSGAMKRITGARNDSTTVYAFERVLGGDRVTVVVNLSRKAQSFRLPADIAKRLQIRMARCGMKNTDSGLELALPGFGYLLGSSRKPR